MSSMPKTRLTSEQYLMIDRRAERKSEFFDGEMFEMAGASERHNLITLNVGGELRNRLRGRPCKTYASDMRVQVGATGLYTYPDVIVACGEARFRDGELDTLLNPKVIIGVRSPSTESYDRGRKSTRYRRGDSLAAYLLIEQDRPHVEHYFRDPDGQWRLTDAFGLTQSVRLNSIDCELPLAEIYDRVAFEPGEEEGTRL